MRLSTQCSKTSDIGCGMCSAESIADMYFARGAVNGKRDESLVRGRVAMVVWLPSLNRFALF